MLNKKDKKDKKEALYTPPLVFILF